MQPYVATKQWRDGFGAGETRITAADLTRIETGISAATQGVTNVENKVYTERAQTQADVAKVRLDLSNLMAALIPVGSIFPFIGGQTPTGFALCNGQTLNRNQFVELFRLIGTKYGTTDTSNFRVPDLSGRFMVGVGAGYTLGDTGGSQTVALTGAQMPIHSHDVTGKAGQAGTSGVGMYASNVGGGSGWQVLSTTESGSISGLRTTSAGSGQAHENRPPYFALEYIIRTGNPAGRI
jgi:microcystin-dependent protein